MLRVLLVDDDEAILAAMEIGLRARTTWQLARALGGAAGCARLAREPFDIVITDLVMPDVDGRAVLAVTRAHAPSALRVLFTGVEVTTADVPDADLVIRKPATARELVELVERALVLPQRATG